MYNKLGNVLGSIFSWLVSVAHIVIMLIMIAVFLVVSYIFPIFTELTSIKTYRNSLFLLNFIPTVMLIILFIYQKLSRNTFFINTKFKWLVFCLPPLFTYIGMFFVLKVSQENLGNLLTTVFGLVSVVSLVFSIAVFFNLREYVDNEKELLKEAVKIIRKARKKLLFISLTPNLGFADAINNDNTPLCIEFKETLEMKISELIAGIKSKKDIEIIIACLEDREIESYLSMKEKGFTSERKVGELKQPIAEQYRKVNTEFFGMFKKLTRKINAEKNEDTNRNIIIARWPKDCIDFSTHNIRRNFPPLTAIITDDNTALICYNAPLLNNSPVSLRGRIIREKEEIESIEALLLANIELISTHKESIA